ncbi:MAG: polymer-forming cytoskeletal protein [Verrucomicrobiales bacterium]|nr:polymer-forming cytoskeletal protein [Verrucomicrobiales bacterium]MCP5560728.1 polymer-forming cytoskeletal protein [Verrucomicrobiaceae bacterium]
MNTLAKDVEIKGSIRFAQQLIVEGKLEGEIVSEGALTIGENGYIKGNIQSGTVVIFGRVDGDITSKERCEAKSTAVIVGDITAGSFAIEEGATFQGRSRVGKVPAVTR